MAGEPEKVELTKDAYDRLMAIKSLMDKAWDDKDTGASFRATLKKVDPSLKIPDDLAASAIEPVKGELAESRKETKELRERLDKFLTDTKDEKDTASLRADLDRAKKDFGLDDDGMKLVMQRMKDKSNPDVEAAAAFVARSIPKPKPLANEGLGGGIDTLFGTTKKEDAFEALHTGGDPFKPGGWFDREAQKILNETPSEQAA